MQLDIYIDDGCLNCEQARRIAERVQKQMPHIEVNLIEITGERPDNVFAVPTYLLDGSTLYLGNPSEQELFEKLEAAPSSEQ